MPARTRARRGAVSFVLLATLCATWALATPMFAGPDEPSHLRKAAAVVRGQVVDVVDPASGTAVVRTPGVLDGDPRCFAFDDDLTADCLEWPSSWDETEVRHTAIGYPTTYYLLTGGPSLLPAGQLAPYLQRLASALAFAALVALAVTAMRDLPAPGTAITGLAVALTPITWFIAGTVNPSSMALAAGIAVWAGGYDLVRTAPLDRLRGAVARTAGPLCLLLLVRRDSMLWASLVVAALAALVPTTRRRALLASRPLWVGIACSTAALVVQLGEAGGRSASGFVAGSSASWSTDLTWSWLGTTLVRAHRQLVGVLGWQDTGMPGPLVLAVGSLVAALLVTAAVRGARRPATVAVGVAAATLTCWVALDHLAPSYAQGRYVLPFAVGAPLVAAMAIAEGPRPLSRGWVLAALATTSVVQVTAFWINLRRYAVGADGPVWFLGQTSWQPPVPSVVLVGVNLAAALALAVHWSRLHPGDGERSPRRAGRRASAAS